MSSAYVQCKLKQMAETPRIRNGDPAESLLDRISLIDDIERCFYRGLIDAFQLRALEIWLNTGEVISRYELLAALEAIASLSRYTDEAFTKSLEGKKGLSTEEITDKLLEHSELFTDCVDYIMERDYQGDLE